MFDAYVNSALYLAGSLSSAVEQGKVDLTGSPTARDALVAFEVEWSNILKGSPSS